LAAVEGVREAKVAVAAPKLREMFSVETEIDLKGGILAALGSIKDAAGAELIASVLGDRESDAGLVAEAIAASEQIGGPEISVALAKLLKTSSADKATSLKAIAALGRMKTADAVAAVAPYARRDDPELRQAALTALSKVGGDSALGAVLPLLENPAADVRRGVVAALGE